MFAIKVLSPLNRSFSTKIRTIASSLKQIRKSSFKAKHPSSYDVKSQAAKDVVLFELENPKYFIAINIASAIQCAFWTYLGVFLFQAIKNSTFSSKTKATWAKILEQERKYGNTLTALSLFFGWAVFASTTFYSFRSIRKIILHKGGNNVTLVTYGLPGYNTVKSSINHVSCMEHRVKAKKYIPVKLKNTPFYFLIDVQGEFLNPQLFDFTVGIKRGFQ